MKVWPFGVAGWAEASNHHMLRWLKTVVVSDVEKAPMRCQARCWEYDWVIDLDVQKFFDSVSWDLVVKAVAAHTDLPWVLL